MAYKAHGYVHQAPLPPKRVGLVPEHPNNFPDGCGTQISKHLFHPPTRVRQARPHDFHQQALQNQQYRIPRLDQHSGDREWTAVPMAPVSPSSTQSKLTSRWPSFSKMRPKSKSSSAFCFLITGAMEAICVQISAVHWIHYIIDSIPIITFPHGQRENY